MHTWYARYTTVVFVLNQSCRIASTLKRYVYAKGMRLKSLGTILLVDDEVSIAEFMQEALVDEGYTVITEYDGARAIAATITHHPDLILCDLHMPGVSGVSFVERIHSDGLADIPVVLMTADNQAPQQYADKQIADYLMKPFDLNELLDCVKRYMTSSTNGAAAE